MGHSEGRALSRALCQALRQALEETRWSEESGRDSGQSHMEARPLQQVRAGEYRGRILEEDIGDIGGVNCGCLEVGQIVAKRPRAQKRCDAADVRSAKCEMVMPTTIGVAARESKSNLTVCERAQKRLVFQKGSWQMKSSVVSCTVEVAAKRLFC